MLHSNPIFVRNDRRLALCRRSRHSDKSPYYTEIVELLQIILKTIDTQKCIIFFINIIKQKEVKFIKN